MKLSKIQHKIYDIIISTLAIAAAVLVLIDLSQGLNDWQKTADQIILAIFTLDYAVRFYIAPDKPKFIGYYGAAEPPVRCGESHLSGLTEPPIDSYSA